MAQAQHQTPAGLRQSRRNQPLACSPVKSLAAVGEQSGGTAKRQQAPLYGAGAGLPAPPASGAKGARPLEPRGSEGAARAGRCVRGPRAAGSQSSLQPHGGLGSGGSTAWWCPSPSSPAPLPRRRPGQPSAAPASLPGRPLPIGRPAAGAGPSPCGGRYRARLPPAGERPGSGPAPSSGRRRRRRRAAPSPLMLGSLPQPGEAVTSSPPPAGFKGAGAVAGAGRGTSGSTCRAWLDAGVATALLEGRPTCTSPRSSGRLVPCWRVGGGAASPHPRARAPVLGTRRGRSHEHPAAGSAQPAPGPTRSPAAPRGSGPGAKDRPEPGGGRAGAARRGREKGFAFPARPLQSRHLRYLALPSLLFCAGAPNEITPFLSRRDQSYFQTVLGSWHCGLGWLKWAQESVQFPRPSCSLQGGSGDSLKPFGQAGARRHRLAPLSALPEWGR